MEVLQNLKLKFGSLCEAFLQVSSMSFVQQLVAKGKIMDKNKRLRRKKMEEKLIDPSQLFELDFPFFFLFILFGFLIEEGCRLYTQLL